MPQLKDSFVGSGAFAGHQADTGQHWLLGTTDQGQGQFPPSFAFLGGGGFHLDTAGFNGSVYRSDNLFHIDTGHFDHQYLEVSVTRLDPTGRHDMDLIIALRLTNHSGLWDGSFDGVFVEFFDDDTFGFNTPYSQAHVSASVGSNSADEPPSVDGIPWAVGETRLVRIEAIGNQLKLYIDGVLQATHTVTTPLNVAGHTYAGLYAFAQAGTPPTGPAAVFVSPMTVDAWPAPANPADPKHSTAVVPDGTAGTPTGILVTAKDANGNPTWAGGDTVVGTVSGPNAGAMVTTTDNGDGTYTLSYTPTHAGTDTIGVTLDPGGGGNPEPISGSPFDAPVAAGAATAIVPSVPVTVPRGGEALVTLRVTDAFGNVVTGFTGQFVLSGIDGAVLAEQPSANPWHPVPAGSWLRKPGTVTTDALVAGVLVVAVQFLEAVTNGRLNAQEVGGPLSGVSNAFEVTSPWSTD